MVFTAGDDAFVNEDLVAQVEDPDDHGGDAGRALRGRARRQLAVVQISGLTRDPTNATFDNIDGETTNRYTPTRADRGYYLRVTADVHRPVQGR